MEAYVTDVEKGVLIIFQFLYGTIIRVDRKNKFYTSIIFQFLYGTIISWNGKKVSMSVYKFQFLYGTIISV